MPIRWDKFTVKAQEAVQRASQLASEHGNPELQPLHLLAALLEDQEGIVPPVLEKIGIGPQTVDTENVSANYDKGVLKISLPKKAEAKPKQIKVNVGSEKPVEAKGPGKAA